MGFYFRKSVNFGPVRLNFSKSGVGVSVGVKGARISTGPRGTYVHVGSNGFYYRQRLDTPSPQARRHVPQQPYVPSPTSSAHVIATADVSHLVDTSSAEILQQINTRARQMRYTPFVIIATLIATISVYLLIDFCANAFTNRWSSKREKVVSVSSIKDSEAKNNSIEEVVTANDRKTPETKDATSTMIPGKSVGQIVLGMTKEEVVRALGKPTSVSSEGVVYKSKKTGNYLKIHLAGDKAIQVDFTSKDFKTEDGIHTGNFREERYASLFDTWEAQKRSSNRKMTLKRGGLTFYDLDSRASHPTNPPLAIGVMHAGATPLRDVQGYNSKEIGEWIPKTGAITSAARSGQDQSPLSSSNTGIFPKGDAKAVLSNSTRREGISESANTTVTIADFVSSGITLVIGLLFAAKTHKEDMLRRTTPLFYELEEDALARFSAIQRACETLARSLRIWRVETNTPTFDRKRNAGASSLVTRKLTHVEHQQPPYIATNVNVWSIKAAPGKFEAETFASTAQK